MHVIVDCEGTPTQEFSALYVDETTCCVVDVFHHYVKYPSERDEDFTARQYVHGLNREFLLRNGLPNEHDLVKVFHEWLAKRPYVHIYAHAPAKERELLSLPIRDVCLKPWIERIECESHKIALAMKLNCIPVHQSYCFAHDYVKWKPKRAWNPSRTDIAKENFFHHCSLYDCFECFLYLFQK